MSFTQATTIYLSLLFLYFLNRGINFSDGILLLVIEWFQVRLLAEPNLVLPFDQLPHEARVRLDDGPFLLGVGDEVVEDAFLSLGLVFP